MLSVADYNHLKLLYDKFKTANLHIKELIVQNNLDDVDVAIQEKEGLLRQIIFFEKPRLSDIKENEELNSIRLNLIELEKENIVLIKSVRENMIKELCDVKRTKRVINAYEPSLSKTVSTVDIKEED